MKSLQYRARLIDPGNTTAERPVEIFGSNRRDMDEWSAKVLASAVADNAVVNLYQMVEQHIAIIHKPKPEAKTNAK